MTDEYNSFLCICSSSTAEEVLELGLLAGCEFGTQQVCAKHPVIFVTLAVLSFVFPSHVSDLLDYKPFWGQGWLLATCLRSSWYSGATMIKMITFRMVANGMDPHTAIWKSCSLIFKTEISP